MVTLKLAKKQLTKHAMTQIPIHLAKPSTSILLSVDHTSMKQKSISDMKRHEPWRSNSLGPKVLYSGLRCLGGALFGLLTLSLQSGLSSSQSCVRQLNHLESQTTPPGSLTNDALCLRHLHPGLIIGSVRNRREMSWSRKIGMVQS